MLPAASAIIGSAAIYGLWSALRRRSALVLYSDDPSDPPADRGTFRAVARQAARYLRTTAVSVSSGQDILDAIRHAPDNLGVVMMVGHGTSTKFFSPARFGVRLRGRALPRWISPDDFAGAISGKLARGAIISLAGCSAGRGAGEPSGWRLSSTSWDGGANSLAARFRDALSRRWVSGEVRGHTVFGTTIDNPQGRTFFVGRSRIGRQGIHIMHLASWPRPRDFNDYRDWNNYARGRVARAWMIGLPIRPSRPT